MLHAVAREDLDAAVVHAHRDRDDELALALAEHGTKTGVEVEAVRGDVELALSGSPWVDGGSDLRSGHRYGFLQGASAGPIGRCGRAGSRAHRSGASVLPRIRPSDVPLVTG